MTQEEKAKRYDKVLEQAKNWYVDAQLDFKKSLETLLPEIKESEDEKISKLCKELIESAFMNELCNKEERNTCIAWFEKQDNERKQLYVRFGDIPSNEKSKIYHGEEEIGDENGVSVYPAFELNGNIVLGLTLPITKTTLYTQQHLLEYDNRSCYLVSGDYVGKGTDGEPLIKNISVIKRLDNYRIKECEKKPVIEMKTPEESLSIDFNEKFKNMIQKTYENMLNTSSKESNSTSIIKEKAIWTAEDEHRIKLLEALCEDKLCESVPNSTMYEEMKITIDWLNSIRPQSKQEWSEEDNELITAAICFIDSYNHNNVFACNGIYKADVSKWLLSLKERIIG